MDSNGYTKPSSQEDALLAPYVPPPAPVVQAEVDPWGDSAFSNDLPSPPSVTPTVSEPIPATATEPTDSTSASASVSAVPVVGSAQAAAEFDAFFDSLGEQK